jgi:arginine decarboxylase
MNNYGIDIFSNNNFFIEDGEVKLNHGSKPSILDIVQDIRSSGIRGPMLLRFPHLVKNQIKKLYKNFNNAIVENNYNGTFNAVFPLKVNQFPNALKAIIEQGDEFNYGLEAGSKAELVLAMSQLKKGSDITVNGFKDEEMITLAFIGASCGHKITLTVEGLNELETIIDVAKNTNFKVPNIGIRIRLHSTGSGSWAKSGGMDAKFGLTSTEIIEAVSLLREAELLKSLSMVHFHIGSQMSDIAPLKKALREAGNIFAELRMMGAKSLDNINIGGGLAVEYEQHEDKVSHNYSVKEFSSSVVFLLGEIMDAKNIKHPNIYTESGRFVVASHAVLVAPVLELFSQDYHERLLNLKAKNPPLVEELVSLNSMISEKTSIEYLHDALDHQESLFTLFDLGYIDLQDRSNAEILVHNIIKKALYIEGFEGSRELELLQARLQERYLVNLSIFQSLPDYWGIQQNFPVMPIHKLEKKPIRAASLWDITCDSDGEIGFNPSKPLHLHDVDLDNEEYFLGFFNVGAYQETLGMNHNLFSRPNEYTIDINDDSYEVLNGIESENILEILNNIGYRGENILKKLESDVIQSGFIEEQEKADTLTKLKVYLEQNGYLRTTY